MNIVTIQDLSNIYLYRMKLLGGKNLKVKEQHIRNKIIPIIGNSLLQTFSVFEVDLLKQKLKDQEFKEATINRVLSTLSHIFTQSIEWKLLDKLPCKIRRYKEQNQRIIYLTQDQVTDLLKSASYDNNPLIHLFILIGVYTGMRCSEILSIRRENVLLESNMLYIPKAKAGARSQPIPQIVCDALRDNINKFGNEGWVFPNPQKTSHLKSIRKTYRRVVKRAGLDPEVIVRHTLRHTAITHLVQAGIDLPTVKRISGHKTLAMVERYSHQNDVHIKNALTTLENRYKVT